MEDLPRTTPVIVGVGEITSRSMEIQDAVEPATLMMNAIERAVNDVQLPEDKIASWIDSISVVPPWAWAYHDLPGLLARKLGAQPHHRVLGDHGGNQPAYLCDAAARRISQGKDRLSIIVGGETLASVAACRKAGIRNPSGWSEPDANAKRIDVTDLTQFSDQDVGTRHGIGLPVHVYPLYENGRRARKQQTAEQNAQESGALYADFDRIACQHKYSWRYNQRHRDATTIRTVSDRNRMICTPYPLLMNAFNTVDMSAACILTSVEHAEELGVPHEKWVFVLGGAGTSEPEQFWHRRDFFSSPAISLTLDATLATSGLTKHDIDCFDFYSCFPIVPKLACDHLGLKAAKLEKPISLLGGLTSFGGAGNNYSMHAITEMARQIRNKKIRNGLVLANGGVLTYQHAVCLSSQPRQDRSEYPNANPLSKHVIQTKTVPKFIEKADGYANIETYTVEYDRTGSPRLAHIVGRLDQTGYRFIANHGDDATLITLAHSVQQPIGRQGIARVGLDGRNTFTIIQNNGKL